MPGMDGIDTTRTIRQSERGRGRHMPIMALSAQAMTGDRARCLDAGMDDYLVKPIRPAALLDAVERLGLEPGQAGGSGAESAGADGGGLLEEIGGELRLVCGVAGMFPRKSSQY